MRLGFGAWKDGGTERIGVECQGIPHYLPLSHYMKTQFNTPKRGGEGKG